MTRSRHPSPGRPQPAFGSPAGRSAAAAPPAIVAWPHLPDPPADRSGPTRYCYLLDSDSDLADAFDMRMRLVVRQVATALVLEVSVGDGWLDDRVAVPRPGLGFLILEGLFALEVHVGDRTATELLGPGDLLQPRQSDLDQLFEREVMCRALAPSRVAVLDAEFIERVRPWPEIILTLLRRLDKRAIELDLHRAVCSHPSLELRLALLLWHLAERWGRVEPDGVRLELPLTHSLLGRLVAAERPSVSRSLARLAEQGLVTGGAGHWHLAGSAETCMSALAARVSDRTGSAAGPPLVDRAGDRGGHR